MALRTAVNGIAASTRAALCALMVFGFSCGDDDRPTGDTGPRTDTGSDASSDVGAPDTPTSCMTDPDCDDGHMCTIDMCAIGGVCRYTPLNERCEDGELCTIERGCTGACMMDSDCDNGNFCDGAERCILGPGGVGDCFPATAEADCNDGNMCTIDACDTEVNGCVYETAEGCDAGPVGSDAGMPDPFDPDVHYEGTFLIGGLGGLGCPPSSYTVNEMTFAVVDGDLRVTGDRFTMTQSPRPDGPDFNVTGTDASCMNVSLSGSFENSDLFRATWMAGPCRSSLSPTGCGSQSDSVVGQRR